MADVLAFWATALVVGAFGFPIAAALLRRLPDAGAGLSFPLGLLFASYGYFILRVLDLLPPGRGGFVAAVALLGLVSATAAGRDRWLSVTWWRAWRGVVIAAALFTFAFFSYVAFRSYNAEIGGTEQPMDLMYLNATMTAEEYPPHDPWLAGQRASYYYFGYLQSGLLTSVAGVPPSTGYNLSLAYTFAAAATGAASLAYALARWMLRAGRRRTWPIAAGALAVVLLLFAGSLSALFEWPAAHGHYDRGLYQAFGVEWMLPCEPGQTENCELDSPTQHWYPDEYWFWWEGSRIIPGTITEFPFFSFLLGDLHPHVMSLPLVLLALGAAAATWRGRSILTWRTHLGAPFPGLAFAVLLGALAFQNTWDVITFSLAVLLAIFARNLRQQPALQAATAAVGYTAPAGAVAVLLYLPWLLDFSSQAGGLKPYVGAGTTPAHLLLQFGAVLAAGATVAAWAIRRMSSSFAVNVALSTAWIPLVPFLGWILLASIDGTLDDGVDARGASGWLSAGIYAGLVWLLSFAAVASVLQRRAVAVPAAMAATGALLLYGSEFFVIKDVFYGGLPRLNTIFKLSYQAWILLAVAGGAGMAVLLASVRSQRWAPFAAAPPGVLVLLALVYPLLAAFNRTEGFERDTAIDGLAALQLVDPGEYELARWVATSTPRDAVIIEASGRRWQPAAGGPVVIDAGSDYSDSGRIASRTGRATPIGWFSHEIQWRGDNAANAAEFARRQEMVDSAYISGDPERVIEIMRSFGAEYLVVGRVELSRYPGLLGDFESFLDVAFRTGNYAVYRLPRHEQVETS